MDWRLLTSDKTEMPLSYLHAIRNLNRYGYLTGMDDIDISLGGADFLNSSQVRMSLVTRD